jgi:hypothetical protein
MKAKLIGAIAVFAVVAILIFTVGTSAAPGIRKATPAAAAVQVTLAANASAPEPHPQIREAIGALRHAQEHMEHAAHDFGGHRVEALHATDEAIRQLEICLKYDKE